MLNEAPKNPLPVRTFIFNTTTWSMSLEQRYFTVGGAAQHDSTETNFWIHLIIHKFLIFVLVCLEA